MDELSELQLINLIKYERNNDALLVLFRRNLPMVNRALRTFYLRSYDENDWKQDALYICYESALMFKPEMGVKFSGFFQLRFLNHAKSLIRFELAKKREPYSKALSLDSQVKSDFVKEAKVNLVINNEFINRDDWEKYFSDLSLMELLAFKNYIGELDEKDCLDKLKCSRFQFIAAKHRCRRKIRKYNKDLG